MYDARESMWAARLWWMLRAFGFDEAAVLDGGWTSWVQEGRAVSTSPPDLRAATFTARPRAGFIVGKERVWPRSSEANTCVSTRSVTAGTRASLLYGRAGHIPEAP